MYYVLHLQALLVAVSTEHILRLLRMLSGHGNYLKRLHQHWTWYHPAL